MTIKETKKFLGRAHRIHGEISWERTELARLQSLVSSSGLNYSNFGIRASGSDRTNLIDAKIDLESQITKHMAKLIKTEQEILKVIDEIDDSNCRLLLKLRYLDFEKWDEIATEMNYSRQRIFQLWKVALQDISKEQILV